MGIKIQHGVDAYAAGMARLGEKNLAYLDWVEEQKKKAKKHARHKKAEAIAIAAGTLAVGAIAAPAIASAVAGGSAAAAGTAAAEAATMTATESALASGNLFASTEAIQAANAAGAAVEAGHLATATSVTQNIIRGLGGMAAAYSSDGDVVGAGLQAASNVANVYQSQKANEQMQLQEKANFHWQNSQNELIKNKIRTEALARNQQLYNDTILAESEQLKNDLNKLYERKGSYTSVEYKKEYARILEQNRTNNQNAKTAWRNAEGQIMTGINPRLPMMRMGVGQGEEESNEFALPSAEPETGVPEGVRQDKVLKSDTEPVPRPSAIQDLMARAEEEKQGSIAPSIQDLMYKLKRERPDIASASQDTISSSQMNEVLETFKSVVDPETQEDIERIIKYGNDEQKTRAIQRIMSQ